MDWVAGHDSGGPLRPSFLRYWLSVPAFAFMALASRDGVRIATSVGLLTMPISCLEKLWGIPVHRHALHRPVQALVLMMAHGHEGL